MMFNGFRSISEYESECRRLGFLTERRSFRKGNEKFFVLVTGLAMKTSTSVESWHLFSIDEQSHLLDGIINGNNANYLGMLAEHGYFPANNG